MHPSYIVPFRNGNKHDLRLMHVISSFLLFSLQVINHLCLGLFISELKVCQGSAMYLYIHVRWDKLLVYLSDELLLNPASILRAKLREPQHTVPVYTQIWWKRKTSVFILTMTPYNSPNRSYSMLWMHRLVMCRSSLYTVEALRHKGFLFSVVEARSWWMMSCFVTSSHESLVEGVNGLNKLQ